MQLNDTLSCYAEFDWLVVFVGVFSRIRSQLHPVECDTSRSSPGESSFSGPKLMGSSCSTVIMVDLPSLSYIITGIFDCLFVSIAAIYTSGQHDGLISEGPWSRLASQNSRMNCRHMPQGLAGGLMSVETANARISPLLAPCSSNQHLLE